MDLIHRTDTSFWTRGFYTVLKPFGKKIITPSQPHPSGSPELTAPKSLLQVCNFKAHKVEDINIYEIISKNASTTLTQPHHRIIYFPGGGWQGPTSQGHWPILQLFATALENTSVTLISYPLAPYDPAPKTFPKLEKVYKTLLSQYLEAGERLTLAGDSAGANLAIALTLNALSKDFDAPCPGTLLLVSPCCDLRHLDIETEPALEGIAKNDPLLDISGINANSDAWRGSWDATDPRVSVLLADVSLLAGRDVRVYGVTGGHDLLAPGAEKFRDNCCEAGVKGKWLTWDGQMHIFPLFFGFGLYESKQAKDWILEVLTE